VSNTKFLRNQSIGSGADTRGQTDGHDEGNRSFSRLNKSAQKAVHT